MRAGEVVTPKPSYRCTTCAVDLHNQAELDEHVDRYHWIDRD